MSWLYTLLGALLFVLAVVDLVWSTLSVGGGGPLSRRVARAVWVGTGRARFAGPLSLLATAVLWVGLLWIAWTLIFMGTEGAVVLTKTGAPAGFWERVYFGGYTVATLGLGDALPNGPVWRMLTVVAAFSGLVLITLGITYYTSVLGAVVKKQRLAAYLHSLGDAPADIVAGAWDGESVSGLDSVLASVASMCTLHARQHFAYPVLHYFRTTEAKASFAVQAARFYDALILMERVVEEGHRPPPASLRLARRSLRLVLDTLHPRYINIASETPPLPDLSPLREAGIPFGGAAEAFAAEDVQEDRRLLLDFVQGMQFHWADASPASSEKSR